jgi:hypothetical protein
MSRTPLCVWLLLCVLVAGPASAAELRLEIADGYVTLIATDTPLAQILAEWARVGGTRIVNGERVTGGPVTIQLDRVPEQQALEVLLRSVAGYLAAPRRVGTTGASRYESVLILATSSAPAAAPASTAGARGPANPIVRPVPSPGEMLGQQPLTADGDGQIASEGFITVGSAPAPRQTPAAGGARGAAGGPAGNPFPQMPVGGARTPNQPGTMPTGIPRPSILPPAGVPPPPDGGPSDPEARD